MNNTYQRLFYILKAMDRDAGYPNGFIKVEINGGTARLQLALNNLFKSGIIYQLYGMKKSEEGLTYTLICDIPNENGRADVKINFDSNNVGNGLLNIEEINVFAVIAFTQKKLNSISCPLVAFTKEEVQWKKEFETQLSADASAKNTCGDKTEQECVSGQGNNNEYQQETDQINNGNAEQGIVSENKYEQSVQPEWKSGTAGMDSEVNVHGKITDSNTGSIDFKDTVVSEKDEIVKEKVYDNAIDNALENIQATEDNPDELIPDTAGPEDIKDNTQSEAPGEEITDEKAELMSKFDAAITSIYTGKNPMIQETENDNSFAAADDILGSAQKNFEDISSINIGEETKNNALNMTNLKDELDKSFESYNPFNINSRNFKWWKINSPGYLNNILFRNSIKTYLLFNPKVMLAHYKYRYIIFGIRNQRNSGRESFVCGVPGVYGIDENPFGNLGSWAQLEGYKPKYGAFGYWIILIDPRTGKLMKLK